MESLDKLQKMKDLLKLVDESISRKEFISSFKAVLDYVKQAESDLSKKIDTKIGARLTDAENELGKITALAEEAKTRIPPTMSGIATKTCPFRLGGSCVAM